MAEFKNLITLTQVFDGAPGEPGAPGKDGQKYYIETNQEEILKFKDQDGWTFSPFALNFRAYEISEDRYVTTSDATFQEGKDYYKLENDKFIYVSNEEYEEGIQYYELNSILPTSSSFNFGYIYNNIYFSLYSSSDAILPSYLTISEIDKSISFAAETFFENEEHSELLESETFYFKFDWVEENSKVAIKPISCRNGVSSDMATFNLHASGFNAAVQSTKLAFSAEGLKVSNGGIKIANASEEEVFYADNLGNLILKGTVYADNGEFNGIVHASGGEFTGTVYAESGEFKGTIKASDGTIGGFIINEENLISADGTIELNGKTGYITAETINLGTGAKISNYIELPAYDEEGNIISIAKIYNPNNNDKKFIETDGILLTSDGILNIGDIVLDGVNSKISGNNFSITPDVARFSNIDCSGVIRTAVFEKNKVQSVGGSMIFRPSYKIEGMNITEKTVVLDKSFEGENEDIVLLISGDGSHDPYTVSQIIDSTIILKETPQKEYTSLIYIGKNDDIIIGINSNNGSILNRIFGEGLTITSWRKTDKPNLFLGNLANLLDSTLEGFGLYADNVYLRGSLTTQIPTFGEKPTYAGINTIHNVQKDGENIVFWAGAESHDKISEAPFMVTENGTIYATSGVFKGSIITDSTISGAHLYTTHLHGGLEGAPGGLYIHDTNIGIDFVQGYESDVEGKQGTSILQIKSDGFRLSTADTEGFIHIIREEDKDPYVNFNGKNINVEKAKIGSLTLEQNIITSSTTEGTKDSSISFVGQNGFYFKENLEDDLFFITNSETHNNSEHFITEGNFTMQKNERKMTYQLNDNGYDLYIS